MSVSCYSPRTTKATAPRAVALVLVLGFVPGAQLLAQSRLPRIDRPILLNNGISGDAFNVGGENFVEPLTVTLCGQELSEGTGGYLVLSSDVLRIWAPECPDLGPAVLEVCNADGCAVEPEGFFYESGPSSVPDITSLPENWGEAEGEFFVAGDHFDLVTEVRMCGRATQFRILNANSLIVIAQPCEDVDWILLEICSMFDCARVVYRREQRLFVRGDANDDNQVDLADAITILQDNFISVGSASNPCRDSLDVNDDGSIGGVADALALLIAEFVGGFVIPPPYPLPGLDPTPDGRSGCSVVR